MRNPRTAWLLAGFTILAVSFLFPLTAAAQNRSISLGAKGGWTYTDSRDEADTGDVFEFDAGQGFAVGVVAASEFHPNVDFQAEGLFVRKKLSADFDDVDVDIKLDYFEVPVLAVLHGRRDGGVTPFAIVGAAFSFLARAEQELEFDDVEETEDIKDQITSADIGIVFGGGVELPQDWGTITVDGRYTLGLRNLDESGEDDIKLGSFAIMGGIVFE